MFENFITKNRLPEYRLKQLWHFYYQKAVPEAKDITVFPNELRDLLEREVRFSRLEPVTSQKAGSGNTEKVLFKRAEDGNLLEAVLMRHQDGRNTVCVSCMIGCPVGCTFCATGKMGFIANLTADEIVDQVLFFQRELQKEAKKVSNVVFMGMGEPLLNLSEVLKAVEILTDPLKMGLSDRRISISTSGYYLQLPKLLDAGFKGKLALSLHAPEQKLRESLMPVAKANPLDKLFTALDAYTAKTNKRIFYEYLLIKGINDTETQALELAELLKGRLAHVNLIPYNPVTGSDYEASGRARVASFIKILEDRKISVSVRASMGQDIAGACGQLASTKATKV